MQSLVGSGQDRTVLWLDELQRYVDCSDPITAETVLALLHSPARIVVVGTLWPEHYRRYTALPTPDDDDHRDHERRLLELARATFISDQFSAAERLRARAVAEHDPRIRTALVDTDFGLTQTLAAAPLLISRLAGCRTAAPRTWAVMTAAIALARLGHRGPLAPDLLKAVAPGYCMQRDRAGAGSDWFSSALEDCTETLHGASSMLIPYCADPDAMGLVTGYTVADYLVAHAEPTLDIPATVWTQLAVQSFNPQDAVRLAKAAEERLRYFCAEALWRQAHTAGHPDAVGELAGLLINRGDLAGALDLLLPAGTAGDRQALAEAVDLLGEMGDPQRATSLLEINASDGSRSARHQLVRHLRASASTPMPTSGCGNGPPPGTRTRNTCWPTVSSLPALSMNCGRGPKPATPLRGCAVLTCWPCGKTSVA